MTTRRLTVRVTGIEDAINSIAPKIIKIAISQSINEVAKQLKTEASLVIRERYNLTKPFVDRDILLTPALKSKPSATIAVYSNRGLRMIGFDAIQTRGKTRSTFKSAKKELVKTRLKNRSKRQGVSVKIWRGSRRTNLRGAFIATMASGHIGVFSRSNTKKMKSNPKKAAIFERAVVTLAMMFGSVRTMARLDDKFQKKFPKILSHNIDRLTPRKNQ